MNFRMLGILVFNELNSVQLGLNSYLYKVNGLLISLTIIALLTQVDLEV